jgi:hypothetical protein
MPHQSARRTRRQSSRPWPNSTFASCFLDCAIRGCCPGETYGGAEKGQPEAANRFAVVGLCRSHAKDAHAFARMVGTRAASFGQDRGDSLRISQRCRRDHRGLWPKSHHLNYVGVTEILKHLDLALKAFVARLRNRWILADARLFAAWRCLKIEELHYVAPNQLNPRFGLSLPTSINRICSMMRRVSGSDRPSRRRQY